MRRYTMLIILTLSLALAGHLSAAGKPGKWVKLFDGKSLNGWKANENSATFKVEKGVIIVNGPRSHMFYVGPVQQHDFKNFELELQIMTRPGANSGVYFHTEYQESGWPAKGYEVQVNNSHTDPKRTAGLYAIKDNMASVAKDNTWFTMTIAVQGKHVVTKVDGQTIIDYTEEENASRPASMAKRLVSSGTFCLQGHDPKSEVHYRSIRVRTLP